MSELAFTIIFIARKVGYISLLIHKIIQVVSRRQGRESLGAWIAM
ncbi:hypothetical protein CIT292_11198 [Citrobacter youngae ATCC 29220]|uniref:Uncharacterized protein n=1 Tax=Citrobacter youngae ATCC 29220 TaxID=500640 RepID=D4BKW8_9ENTR|nr:hypothetical protein CIT292_11198 [Citrobacter youngae ATCC 29220]